MRGLVSEDGKDFPQVKKLMSFAAKIRVEEFLENHQETHSTITRTFDSGVGTWSPAPTECGSEEGAEGLECMGVWQKLRKTFFFFFVFTFKSWCL